MLQFSSQLIKYHIIFSFLKILINASKDYMVHYCQNEIYIYIYEDICNQLKGKYEIAIKGIFFFFLIFSFQIINTVKHDQNYL